MEESRGPIGAGRAGGEVRTFPLTVQSATEDLPRLITSYGRCCGGELALVMRPSEQRTLLVRVDREGGALASWSHPGEASDAPQPPTVEMEASAAVARVKHEQREVPRPGATTFKGSWRGQLVCEGGGHRVELRRKVASYGTLRVWSQEGGWGYEVERQARWYGAARGERGASATLREAIQLGLARALGVVGEACSVRDTHRRAALDSGWAATHPEKPARERPPATERLKEPSARAPRASKSRAAPSLSLLPTPLRAPLSLPSPPVEVRELQSAAEVLTAEVGAWARLREIGWIWSYTAEADLWYGSLLELGLDEVVERLQSWLDAPDVPSTDLLVELDAMTIEHVLSAVERERVQEALDQLERELKQGPALLTRARWLIRYATNAASSRLCQGREREEASAAIEKAAAEYETIRKLVEAEVGEPDGLVEENPRLSQEVERRLRALARGIGLAAAKLARSCATGQQTVAARLGSPVRNKAPDKAEDNACGCNVGESSGKETRPEVVEEAKAPRGDLVIVPLYQNAKTVEELSDWLRPNTNAYLRAPTLKESKKWLDRAAVLVGLKGFEIEKAPDRPQPPARFSLRLTHPRFGDDPGISRQACLVLEASLALVDLHVIAHGPNRSVAAGSQGCREWLGESAGRKAAVSAPANPGQDPPARALTKRRQAPKTQSPPASQQAPAHRESGSPADKDGLLMDAFTRAIQTALAPGGS